MKQSQSLEATGCLLTVKTGGFYRKQVLSPVLWVEMKINIASVDSHHWMLKYEVQS